MGSSHVLLTFDLEEFDIPLEYGSNVCWEEQIATGRQGMKNVIEVLDRHQVSTTIFTTAAYALENQVQLKYLAQNHEIASHSFFHSSFKEEDLSTSKFTLEQITGQQISGFRMPRLKGVSMKAVHKAGYTYDSSVNPTYIPGKYNNLNLPTSVYKQDEVYRIPCSVSPILRIPLFWLAFKNFPYFLYKMLAEKTIKKKGYINLYFHPWEFTDISKYKLPSYVKRYSGSKMIDKLDVLIKDLKIAGDFTTMSNYISKKIRNKH